MLERDSAALSQRQRRRRAAARRARPGGGRRRGPPHRRARRPRPQRQPDARLARARRRARGRRPRRAAPPQLPARVRGRHLLHARRGLHALPRSQHAARACGSTAAAARWPSRPPTPPRWRSGRTGIAAQVDRFLVPSAFALRRLRAARRAGRRARERAVVGAARVRGRLARRRRAPRPLRRAAEPREGRRRRRGRLPRGRPAARGGGRRPGRRRAARARGGRRRALHRPRRRRSELAELRRDAAVAVVPSRYAEILPLAALEAMAAGVPGRRRPLAAASPSSCPRRACTRPATSTRSPPAPGACGATRRRADRALAIVRERCAPAAVARALGATVYA